MKVPYPLPSGIVTGGVGRARIDISLPLFKKIITRLNRVDSFISVGPHKNILSVFHHERGLFNEGPFKREKMLGY
jgi:hypothetical protein